MTKEGPSTTSSLNPTRAPKKKSRVRSLGKWLVINLAVLLVLMLAAEFACRHWILKDAVPYSDATFFELMKKYHGREPGMNIPKRPVILGLGDSFGTEGKPGTNFFEVLQKKLDAASKSFSVVNLSVPRYETAEELHMLRHYGLRYRPRIIIHALFVGNDLYGNSPGRLVTFAGEIPLRVRTYSPFSPRTWVLPAAIYRRIRWWRVATHTTSPEQFSSENFMEILRGYLPHFHRGYVQSAAWTEVRETVSEMIRAGRGGGAKYVIAILPDQLQVEDRYQEKVFQDPTVRRGDYDLTLPQKLLTRFAKEHGVPVIDLYPAFRSKGRRGGLYLSRNTHWNDAGNRLAAETIARKLAELDVID